MSASLGPSFAPLSHRLRRGFHPTVIVRGGEYAREGRVRVTERRDGYVAASVFGSNGYVVVLEDTSRPGRLEISVRCSCPYFDNDFCKHIWAVLVTVDREPTFARLAASTGAIRIAALDDDDDAYDDESFDDDYEPRSFHHPSTPPATNASGWREALETAARERGARAAAIPSSLDRRRRVEIGYLLDVDDSRRTGRGLRLQIRERAVTRSAAAGAWRAAQLTRQVIDTMDDPVDRAILEVLCRPQSAYAYTYAGAYTPSTVDVLVPGAWDHVLVPLARSGRCEVLLVAGRPTEKLEVDEGGPYRLVIALEERAGGALSMRGEVRRFADVVGVPELGVIVQQGIAFVGARAIRVESDAAFGWVAALRRETRLDVPAADAEEVVRGLLATCGRESLELPASFAIAHEPLPFVTRVHVRTPQQERWRAMKAPLLADVSFDYHGARAGWREHGDYACAFEERRLVVRDRVGEARALGELAEVGFSLVGGRGDPGSLQIAGSRLGAAVAALPARSFEIIADGARYRHAAKTSFSVRSGIDWFDLDAAIDFDGVPTTLPALLAAAKSEARTVRLGDGSIGILPEAWLERLKRVAGMGRLEGEQLRFSRAQIALVEAMLHDDREPIVWDGPIQSLRSQLASLERLKPMKAPRGFRGKLRPYQQTGLAWLRWVEEIGVSGCLADDMGLGKTVQVLAHLVARKADGRAKGPSLVVAPRSVVYNWLDEAGRFTPSLRVAEHVSGASLDDVDLVVTTYGRLRQEIDALVKHMFDYVILDEAHAIKNPGAVTTKAALLLRSHHRLALSGTPVENHLGELASLFDFLNPGMLGPSVRGAAQKGLGKLDAEGAARLGRGLKPFLLRRKKSDVLADLPDRIEQTIHCDMAKDQRVAYDRAKKHFQTTLLARVRRDGVGRSTVHVLEALLRLRQIACHTALVDPSQSKAESGKLDALIEQIVPLAQEGKKALVFSQFTSFLDIVGAALEEQGVTFTRLDGKTTDRKARVERFQNDPACPVFLISLKAGGLGLNLTAAEYVFLLDPWWNPAAEAQAIDRAHRIGQTRTVVAYRLLAKDSIEERVAELQAKKRELVASVFAETEAGPLKGLSVEDVEMLLA